MRFSSYRRGAMLVAAAAVVLVGAQNASAQLAFAANSIQSLYYKEVSRDGRFYVFNNADNAVRFEASGEMGVGITRPGVGPNGETVVADSETALELFFFKHGLSEKVERPKPPTLNIVWRDGKTRMTLGKAAYIEMSSRIQPRFTLEMPDDNVKLGGTESAGDLKPSFRIRRAKFKLEGWFYKPELEFELQLNWPDASTSQPNRFLEDANIDWDITGKKTFRVKFGQFKAPYGRQQLTSSGSQQFVDRSIVDERYNPGRETGLALWGTLLTHKLDWRVMASNGNGRSQSANDNAKLLYTARLQYQLIGATRMNQWSSGALLTEGDLGDSASGPLLAVAANVLANDRHFAATSAGSSNNKDLQYGGDLIFKHRGFSAVAEYTMRETEKQKFTEVTEDGVKKVVASIDPKYKDQGFHVQASYAFKATSLGVGSYLEVAGRYAQYDPSDAKEDDKRSELGGAVSYYYSKHNFKVQADFRQVKDEAKKEGEQKANEFRLQWQFIF